MVNAFIVHTNAAGAQSRVELKICDTASVFYLPDRIDAEWDVSKEHNETHSAARIEIFSNHMCLSIHRDVEDEGSSLLTTSGEVAIPLSTETYLKSFILRTDDQFTTPAGRWKVEWDHLGAISNSMRPPPTLMLTQIDILAEELTAETTVGSIEQDFMGEHTRKAEAEVVLEQEFPGISVNLDEPSQSPSREITERTEPLSTVEEDNTLSKYGDLEDHVVQIEAHQVEESRAADIDPVKHFKQALHDDDSETSSEGEVVDTDHVNTDKRDDSTKESTVGPTVTTSCSSVSPARSVSISAATGMSVWTNYFISYDTESVNASTSEVEVPPLEINRLHTQEYSESVKSNASETIVNSSLEESNPGSMSKNKRAFDLITIEDDDNEPRASRKHRTISTEPDHADQTHKSTEAAQEFDEIVSLTVTKSNQEASGNPWMAPRLPMSRRSAPAYKFSDLLAKDLTLDTNRRPLVVFSGTSISGQDVGTIKLFRGLGGVVVNDIKVANMLCVGDGPLMKTSKLIIAVASGKYIVHDGWFDEFCKTKMFPEPAGYLPMDRSFETLWKSSLAEAVARGKQGLRLLDGYDVYLTFQIQQILGKQKNELRQVILTLGAKKCSFQLPQRRNDKKRMLFIGHSHADAEHSRITGLGATLYDKDLLLVGVLRGRLELDSDEFKIKEAVKR